MLSCCPKSHAVVCQSLHEILRAKTGLVTSHLPSPALPSGEQIDFPLDVLKRLKLRAEFRIILIVAIKYISTVKKK